MYIHLFALPLFALHSPAPHPLLPVLNGVHFIVSSLLAIVRAVYTVHIQKYCARRQVGRINLPGLTACASSRHFARYSTAPFDYCTLGTVKPKDEYSVLG